MINMKATMMILILLFSILSVVAKSTGALSVAIQRIHLFPFITNGISVRGGFSDDHDHDDDDDDDEHLSRRPPSSRSSNRNHSRPPNQRPPSPPPPRRRRKSGPSTLETAATLAKKTMDLTTSVAWGTIKGSGKAAFYLVSPKYVSREESWGVWRLDQQGTFVYSSMNSIIVDTTTLADPNSGLMTHTHKLKMPMALSVVRQM